MAAPRIVAIGTAVPTARLTQDEVRDMFAAQPGTLFSLIALPEAVVSVGGARWELARETLAIGARGLHNEVGAGGRVRVECHSGKLLLLEGNFRALHD